MKGYRIGIAILIAFVVFVWNLRITTDPLTTNESTLYADPAYVPPPAPLSIPSTVFFVGDIMLGRAVETKMDTRGKQYPFEGVLQNIFSPDITVGNFEGVVSPIHTQAPPFTFKFSIKPEFLKYLSTIGFDVLSLANNHSLDYGTTSLEHTRTLCALYGLSCSGDPKNEPMNQTFVKKIGTHTVGMIFIHTLYGQPRHTELIAQLTELCKKSDVQIAYIHWGEEYVLVHNPAQEKLAQTLIDNGVDVVVGHHPHVVQDIELYKNGLIVYSLGNFIFDQYFSSDVQEMIGLHMEITDDTITYTVIPYTSIWTRSQPQHMDEKTATKLNARIFESISNDERVNSSLGTIVMPR